jgi:hypothetical protein
MDGRQQAMHFRLNRDGKKHYSLATVLRHFCFVMSEYPAVLHEMSYGKINSPTFTFQKNVLQAAVYRICSSRPKQIHH